MGIGSTMGSGSYWAVLGAWAGEAFMAYGLALMIACLGPTILALVLHVLLMTRDRGRPVTVALELVYGLLNPVMYLLVFQPGLFRSTTPAVLTFFQTTALFAYWSWRLAGSRVATGDRGRRAAAFAITTAAVLLIASTAVRDLVVTVIAPPDLNGLPVVVVLVAPLYVFPLWIGSSQLMRLVRETDGSDSGFFFKSRVAVFVAAGVATAGTVLVALASMNQSNDAARSLVRAHRADILAAAGAEGSIRGRWPQ